MEKEKLNILIVPSWYPSEDNSIRGIFFKEQSEALTEAGHNISVIYAETEIPLKKMNLRNLKKYHFQTSIEKINNVLTYRNKGFSFPPRYQALKRKFWINRMIKLADCYIKDNGKPDIIHAHTSLWGGYAAYLISRKYKVPYVVTEHYSAFIRNLITDEERKYAKLVFDNSSAMIAVSDTFKQVLDSYTKNNITVIPNIVDTDFFYSNNVNREGNEKFTFLQISFLNKNKGVDLLIRAFSSAFKDRENVVLKIGGDGEERGKLEKLVKELDVEDKVEFLGMLTRERVKEEMYQANCFVLASHFETFGIVLIESLSTGCPIIATKCGGPEGIVNEDVGILVEKNNMDALSQALLYMYSNYKHYDHNTIRNYAIKNYSKEIITGKITSIYRDVLKGNIVL